MKKMITLTLVLLSTTTISQVRPTGGGVFDKDPKEPVGVHPNPYTAGGGGVEEQPPGIKPSSNPDGEIDEKFLNENTSPAIRFNALHLQLIQNEKACNGERLNDSKSIIDIYYRLVLYKMSFSLSAHCDYDSAYLNCLNDNSVKLVMAAIKKDKEKSIRFLIETYKLEKASANQLIDFFSDLEGTEVSIKFPKLGY